MYERIVISSGHGLIVRGATGVIDEVDEARRVVERVADELTALRIEATTYHDDVSETQSENLERIVHEHNSRQRDLDISIHFNAYVEVEHGMGVEVLYRTQSDLAAEVSAAIASCGLINRGAKLREDLYFLNNTDMPAILIEVCFVDSVEDADVYEKQFSAICKAIAQELAGADEQDTIKPNTVSGKVSWFGGPEDSGVDADEGLAFIYDVETAPHLFLGSQPEGTSGLARRLNPAVPFIAMRWDYDKYPKEMLASMDYVALVRAPSTGRSFLAWPSDWGPHIDTDRVADISQGLMEYLAISTDDLVEVTWPIEINRRVT